MVVALWLCLVVWIGVDLSQSRERELRAAVAMAGNLARLLEGHLQSTAQKVDLRLSEFALRHQYEVAEGRPRGELESELGRYLTAFPEAHSFRVANAEGNYIYDASGVLPPVNIADRPYFRRLRDQPMAGLVVSEPLKSRVTDDSVIVFARRLEGRNREFAGIVLSSIRADYFERFYASLDVGQRGVIAFWGRNLELFARRPKLASAQGTRLVGSPLEARLAVGESEGSYLTKGVLDGERRVFVFRAMEGLPLVVTVGLAEADILDEWYRRAAVYGVMAIVLMAALIFLVRAWTQSFRRAEAMAEQMTAAFQEKSREARALLDSIPDPAWLLDTEGVYLAVNEAFCRYIRRPMAEVLGGTVDQLFSPEEASRLRAGQLEAYEAGQPVRQEVWLDLQGARHPFEFLRVPVYNEAGEPRGLAGVAWDMSERYEAAERQRLITHVFDNSSEAILILDADRRIVTFNKAFSAITGYRLDEMLGEKPRFVSGDNGDTGFFDGLIQQLPADGTWRGEMLAVGRDGQYCPVLCHLGPIHDEQGVLIHWSAFITDLSERKATEARIDSLVHRDQLTDLPNRQGFARSLGDWLRAGRPGALVMLDINQLSRVNDAFGHEAGDVLLRTIGERLRATLRDKDILGRLGDDQFGVLVQAGGDAKTTDLVVRKLLDAVARPVRLSGSDVVSTACAGVCRLPEDGNDGAALLRNADAALHHAKKLGQGVFQYFASDMNERMAAGLRLESDLRWALQRQELVLYYQPQVAIDSGRVIGFESLLRWRHPEFGLVAPGEFIPLAEASRLILPIGAWVLAEACRQAKAWQDMGLGELTMAVNLSAVQFLHSDIVATVAGALQASGLAPRWLELEVTESVLMAEPERGARIMDELKALGVQISLDDFGTGYSSLSYLQRFPIGKIKVDRSFISDLPANGSNAAIVRMVIGMARELQQRVIAEGVETADQLAFLRRQECDEFQGYLYSPPVPAVAIPNLLAQPGVPG